MPRDSQSKAWMLTLNNPVLDALEICAIFELLDVKYIWQFEVGENGTPHVQAFIEFAKKKRFSYVRRHLDDNGFGELILKIVMAELILSTIVGRRNHELMDHTLIYPLTSWIRLVKDAVEILRS